MHLCTTKTSRDCRKLPSATKLPRRFQILWDGPETSQKTPNLLRLFENALPPQACIQRQENDDIRIAPLPTMLSQESISNPQLFFVTFEQHAVWRWEVLHPLSMGISSQASLSTSLPAQVTSATTISNHCLHIQLSKDHAANHTRSSVTTPACKYAPESQLFSHA